MKKFMLALACAAGLLLATDQIAEGQGPFSAQIQRALAAYGFTAPQVLSLTNLTTTDLSTTNVCSGCVGTFADVAYDSGNFTANGSMTWTVDEADQKVYKWVVIEDLMTVIFDIQTTTVGGTPSTNLRIAIPGGYAAPVLGGGGGAYIQANWIIDNGTQRTSVISIDSTGTQINCWPSETTGMTNWTASTNLTRVAGVLTFQVNIP